FVVAQAGRKGSVTVATNMAGRGTDIVLGGNPEMQAKAKADPEQQPEEFKKHLEDFKKILADERPHVISQGGLHILGTERHESRRIDNQLRGRSGRQGDPGTARFYLSLEDDLLRIFGAERMSAWLDRLGMEEGVPIEHRYLTKAIENAQKKVEARNFDIRKNLIEYDDVMNQQRKTVYTLRRQVLEGSYFPVVISAEDSAAKAKEETFEVKLDERLAAWVKPILETVVRAYGRGAAPGEILDEKEIEKGAGPLPLDKIKWLDVARLEQEIYYHFGCRVPLEDFPADPKGALAKLQDAVSHSLSAQRERLLDTVDQLIMALVDDACPVKGSDEEWDLAGLAQMINEHFALRPPATDGELKAAGDRTSIEKLLYDRVVSGIEAKEKELSPGLFLRVFRLFYLEEIDRQWIEHLESMDHLRHGIGLRGYGHRDPKQEYKKEGYAAFVAMMGTIQTNVVKKIFRVQIQRKEDVERMVPKARRKVVEGRGGEASQTGAAQQARGGTLRAGPKVGRNDPCPCGSGKKYKKCHGLKEGDAAAG
ncbi:MAG: SEC-C domain-containing protein, partial [Deltaproteobacteria bacterium]|nr:SEC-C domain-containing protein [Deltaproteobacteria bacterium]